MNTPLIQVSNEEITLTVPQSCQLSLPNTNSNRKVMIVLSRLLTDLTFQSISEGFGYKYRQWSDNYCRLFKACDRDLLLYLKRENKLEDAAFALIEAQIMAAPFLSLHEHYLLFRQQHPEINLCEETFRTYVSRVDSCKLLRQAQKLISTGDAQIDSLAYLKELLETLELHPRRRKEIVNLFPDSEPEFLPKRSEIIAASFSSEETASTESEEQNSLKTVAERDDDCSSIEILKEVIESISADRNCSSSDVQALKEIAHSLSGDSSPSFKTDVLTDVISEDISFSSQINKVISEDNDCPLSEMSNLSKIVESTPKDIVSLDIEIINKTNEIISNLIEIAESILKDTGSLDIEIINKINEINDILRKNIESVSKDIDSLKINKTDSISEDSNIEIEIINEIVEAISEDSAIEMEILNEIEAISGNSDIEINEVVEDASEYSSPEEQMSNESSLEKDTKSTIDCGSQSEKDTKSAINTNSKSESEKGTKSVNDTSSKSKKDTKNANDTGSKLKKDTKSANDTGSKSKKDTKKSNDIGSSPISNMSDIVQKRLLVTFLSASGVPYAILALLFGVSKTTIHNWVYWMCTNGLEQFIISSIGYWSGEISVDEKWVKIKGKWHYVLVAVDAKTGFPLLIRCHATLDNVSWKLFFVQFKHIYGTPKLIISDGSFSLWSGRLQVFSRTRHQLCKFHKLKNLIKFIWRWS